MIDIAIKLFGSLYEGRDNLALVDIFSLSVYHAGLDQRDQVIREYFCVNAEVLLVAEEFENRVRNATLSHLQAGAVLNQLRDIVTDLFNHRIIRGDRINRVDVFIMFYEVINIGHMHHRISADIRHVPVYLTDGDSRGFNAGLRLIAAGAEVDITGFIRRRAVKHRHIAADFFISHCFWLRVEMHRQEFSSAFLYAGSGIFTEKIAYRHKMSVVFWIRVRRFPYIQALQNAHIFEFHASCLAQNLHQVSRFRAVMSRDNHIPASNLFYRFLSRNQFTCINILPFHFLFPFCYKLTALPVSHLRCTQAHLL